MKQQTPEDKLRKRIVLALSKDQDLSVVDNHGPNENGIDIIVLKKDIFGDDKCYGIQVKVGDIYARRRGRNSGLQEIIGQLAVALGHRFPPKDQYLDVIYLVTDGEIKSSAREYILNAKIGFRTIFFVDKHTLNSFLEQKLKKYESD